MINFAKDIKFVNIIWGMELVSNYFGRFLLRLETSLVGEGISQHVGPTWLWAPHNMRGIIYS